MNSIWNDTVQIAAREPLKGDRTADVVVIGAGLAGILTAWRLDQKGMEVLVLEADRIGSGQTCNTTAKITSQHNLIYADLIKTAGEEKAYQYAAWNERAINEYEKLVKDKRIECDYERCSSYLYSCLEDECLKREAEAAGKLGIASEFVRESGLPFEIKGAVRFDGQARFHPLKFVKAISERLNICEQTRVIKVKDDQAITDQGTVSARHIVFATHFPIVNAPGYYFARMHQERSYVIALEGAEQLYGNYLSIDSDGLSFRNYGQMLLLGGGSHRTGENTAGGQYRMLRGEARRLWPKSREVAHWSAQDCMTLDKAPYIGKYAQSAPGWYVLTGFGKWGMTSSMVGSIIIADMIAGKDCRSAEVFSPQRHVTKKAVKELIGNSNESVKSLSRRIFTGAKVDAIDLEEGCGGVVELDGEKAGAYKKDGKVYVVPVKCPHMGCQLEWNPDERTWECPCHGSRFDYKGRLLDDPAREDLI